MRVATKDEVDEIRRIAQDKLRDYENRVPAADYQRVLMMAMVEVASDMGLRLVVEPHPGGTMRDC